MKTQYKIIITIFCVLLGVLFVPLVASNVYCDYIAESCSSRITGVGPGGVYLPVEWGTNENCLHANDDGTLELCPIDIAQINWPFPPRIPEHECNEVCSDVNNDRLEPDQSLSECAEGFEIIYEEFQARPMPSCALHTSNVQCEPVGFESVIRNHDEFNQSKCPLNFQDWAYLSKYNDEVWYSLSPHYSFDMNKVNFEFEIPFVLEKWGYDNCDSFHIYVLTHDEKREKVLHYPYDNICQSKSSEIKYQKYSYDLSRHGLPLELENGQYIIYLFRDELHPLHFTDEHLNPPYYQEELTKFYFSYQFTSKNDDKSG